MLKTVTHQEVGKFWSQTPGMQDRKEVMFSIVPMWYH